MARTARVRTSPRRKVTNSRVAGIASGIQWMGSKPDPFSGRLAIVEKPTIALLEPNPLLRAAVKTVLEKDGCTVKAFLSGEKMVRCIQAEEVDLSIASFSALGQPALGALLQLLDTINPPAVILLVAADQPRPAAFVDYLVKPFSKRELLLSVRSRLQLICLRKVLDRNEDQLSRAEEALERTREQLEERMRQLSGEMHLQEKVLREMRAGIHVVDSDLRIVRWNQTMNKIMGAPDSDRGKGRPLASVFPPLREEPVAMKYYEAFDRGKETHIPSVTFKGNDGRKKEVSIHLFPLSPRRRKNAQMLCIVEPVKREKRRGGKLPGQERKEAVAQTAVTLNHEINNPLTTILTNTQLLLEETERLDKKIVQRLKRIESESRRIKKVTQSLASLTNPTTTEYAKGIKMIKLPA